MRELSTAGGRGRRGIGGLSGLFVALLLGVAFASSPFACSSAAQLQGSGAHCATVDYCQLGFICCNDPKGSNTCMSSAACIQPMGGGGADATMGNTTPGDDAAPGDDATMPAPGSDATTGADTGAGTDTGSPPMRDATAPQDTGTSPPEDTGAPPEDTGTPPEDTGAPPADTGAGDMDAGTTE